MKPSVKQLIVVSQTILGLCLFGCLLIIPNYFFSSNQGGVSNYGTNIRTQWLFVVGFGAAALGAFLDAVILQTRNASRPQLQAMLYILSALYLAVMLSTFPYKLSPGYARLHEQISVTLFVGMFVTAAWLRFKFVKSKSVNWAFVLFGCGVVLLIASTWGPIHMLFSGQIISGIAFAYILSHLPN